MDFNSPFSFPFLLGTLIFFYTLQPSYAAWPATHPNLAEAGFRRSCAAVFAQALPNARGFIDCLMCHQALW